jgi:putative transposase
MENRTYRMYGLVPYNISPIQQGIQFGHAVVEYGLKYSDTPEYQQWAKYDKTFIILNGGTTNDNSERLGSLNRYRDELNDIGILNAECDILCFLSKNLYNMALYTVKKHYNQYKEYLNYNALDKLFNSTNQTDYRSLIANCSQQILKLFDKNFKSFFELKKSTKTLSGKPQTPKFKHKTLGRNIIIYDKTYLSKKTYKKEKLIHLSQTSIKLNSKIPFNLINQVRIIPRKDRYIIEIVYTKQEETLVVDNGKYCGIDLGMNNLFAVSFNDQSKQNLLINGRPLKAINQYYNKQISKYKSELEICNKKKKSNKTTKLTNKRNNKIKDYVHKCTRLLVERLKQNDISKVVIGKNDQWKTNINIGKKNNQNFVSIPHAQIINVLTYKLKLVGIDVILREESYTSKCSAYDREPIKKHETYKGSRIKRGLFKTSNGKLVNADINGASNILLKALPKAYANGIEGIVVYPVKLNPKI